MTSAKTMPGMYVYDVPAPWRNFMYQTTCVLQLMSCASGTLTEAKTACFGLLW